MENYPIMDSIDEKKAPWNQSKIVNEKKEILVTISMTLSKSCYVEVSDYTLSDSEKDENGEYYTKPDYSSCNLKKAVKEQIILPDEALEYLSKDTDIENCEDIKGWSVDDFEVVTDE